MHHYTDCGLETVWLTNGYRCEKHAVRIQIEIEDKPALHQVLAKLLINRRNLLSCHEIHFLRREMSMSVHELASVMGVQSEVIERWERGETGLPRVADVSLRALFVGSRLEESEPELYLHILSETECRQSSETLFLTYADNGWCQSFLRDSC
ncbi:hypothetical protein SGGMMB4_04491 [Sodalis glossinidius str. 'morsitans']|nr:transcriptional regulator [Sodalis glossinidius]CRL46142.1 hypothetical protein SGGMMB4_04491 [Sodalis glossinidius str. 'morsitans']